MDEQADGGRRVVGPVAHERLQHGRRVVRGVGGAQARERVRVDAIFVEDLAHMRLQRLDGAAVPRAVRAVVARHDRQDTLDRLGIGARERVFRGAVVKPAIGGRMDHGFGEVDGGVLQPPLRRRKLPAKEQRAEALALAAARRRLEGAPRLLEPAVGDHRLDELEPDFKIRGERLPRLRQQLERPCGIARRLRQLGARQRDVGKAAEPGLAFPQDAIGLLGPSRGGLQPGEAQPPPRLGIVGGERGAAQLQRGLGVVQALRDIGENLEGARKARPAREQIPQPSARGFVAAGPVILDGELHDSLVGARAKRSGGLEMAAGLFVLALRARGLAQKHQRPRPVRIAFDERGEAQLGLLGAAGVDELARIFDHGPFAVGLGLRRRRERFQALCALAAPSCDLRPAEERGDVLGVRGEDQVVDPLGLVEAPGGDIFAGERLSRMKTVGLARDGLFEKRENLAERARMAGALGQNRPGDGGTGMAGHERPGIGLGLRELLQFAQRRSDLGVKPDIFRFEGGCGAKMLQRLPDIAAPSRQIAERAPADRQIRPLVGDRARNLLGLDEPAKLAQQHRDLALDPDVAGRPRGGGLKMRQRLLAPAARAGDGAERAPAGRGLGMIVRERARERLGLVEPAKLAQQHRDLAPDPDVAGRPRGGGLKMRQRLLAPAARAGDEAENAPAACGFGMIVRERARNSLGLVEPIEFAQQHRDLAPTP